MDTIRKSRKEIEWKTPILSHVHIVSTLYTPHEIPSDDGKVKGTDPILKHHIFVMFLPHVLLKWYLNPCCFYRIFIVKMRIVLYNLLIFHKLKQEDFQTNCCCYPTTEGVFMKSLLALIAGLVLLSGCNVTQNSEDINGNETQIETRSFSSYPGCHRYATVYNVIEDSVTRKVSPACTRCTREEYHLATVHSATLLWKCVEPGCGTRYTTQAEGNDICSDLPDDIFHIELPSDAVWLKCKNNTCSRYGLTHDIRLVPYYSQKRTQLYASGNCRRCSRTEDHKIVVNEGYDITECSKCHDLQLTLPRRSYSSCIDG